MREFVVVGHTTPTSDFSLDDLPGAGRVDVLCRCVNSAFVLSHSVREDVRLHLVLRGEEEATVRFEGDELRYLNPDERSTAALIREALDEREEVVGHQEVESTPGVHVSKKGFEEVVEETSRRGEVIELHENGEPLVDAETPEHGVFVLSDDEDFTDEERGVLEEVADASRSVGLEVLHADHSMTVVHNWLDTEGFERY
ncbi:MAG: tRNA (pseudouridine(54)-N(1))-methyltransferase TrmY [Halobacteria archaeon]|nr:tRNA (pseudouridine(54)-N(1))-methyltransferase TrmY [Halobacteria archaeon]